LPKLEEVDWLIVMGGSMSAYDENDFPWLKNEKQFIEQAILTRKTVLGICLGAQLVAEALGARVYPNSHKEIGWFRVRLTEEGTRSPLFYRFPGEFKVFHWHADTFDLPDQAVRVVTSQACLNQAFVFGESVVGLQFHLDFTKQSVEQLVLHCRTDIQEGAFVQGADAMLSTDIPFEETNKKMCWILDGLEKTP
jgi:GMP synthase (glutamine-hydrolysing)